MFTDTASIRPLARHAAHWAIASPSTHVVSALHETGVLGEGDELEWGDQTEAGVRPADQRFDGEDLAGAQVQLRLVVQDEVAALRPRRAALRRG